MTNITLKKHIKQKKYLEYVGPKYLQTLAQEIKPLKERSYELMHLQTGHRVLDVGCGPGTDTIPLGRLVGSAGEVIGIDIDHQMIEIANKNTKETNIADWVIHDFRTNHICQPIKLDNI